MHRQLITAKEKFPSTRGQFPQQRTILTHHWVTRTICQLCLSHVDCCITENAASNTSAIATWRLTTSFFNLSTSLNKDVQPCHYASRHSLQEHSLFGTHPCPPKPTCRTASQPISDGGTTPFHGQLEPRRNGNAKRVKSVPSRGSIGVDGGSSWPLTDQMHSFSPLDCQNTHSRTRRRSWRLAGMAWYQNQTPHPMSFILSSSSIIIRSASSRCR